MTYTSLRLVDGAREMILIPRQDQGVYVQNLDAPSPAVREVSEERTDDDGEDDSTQLFGARAVSLDVLVTRSATAFEDELSRFLHPRLRPYLIAKDDGWAQERRLRLRMSQFGGPRGVELAPDQRRIQAQWRAPDGVWEAAEPTTVPDITADIPGSVGRAYPRTYPWSYTATMQVGASLVTNVGTVPSHYTARLYGPCTGPRLINETLGEQIAFTSALVLGPGEYVEVGTRDKTAFLLSMPGAARLNQVDYDVTSWPLLESGEQLIRYAPLTASAGAAAVIEYRPAWL